MAVLKLLRNQTLYATHDDALTAVTQKAQELGDGELWVATYGEAPNAKSILALKRTDGLTVFDNEASSDAITAAIQALDKTDTPEAKKFVTSVSETDGIISVSRGAVTSTDKTITLTDGSDGGINLAVNIDGTTIVKNNTNGTLSVVNSALIPYVGENAINVSDVDADNKKTISLVIPDSEKVLSQDTNGLITTIVLKSVTPSSENVREEYQLQGINGQKLGTDTIKIYKDQTLKSATFENQILTLTYILADGSESAVNIDMSSIILETEVENGIQAIDHRLSIKLDTTGDDTGEGKFLTVGPDGLKLDGVTDAITSAINALDVTDTAVEGKYVSQVNETDGKVSVTRANVCDATLNEYVKGTDELPLVNTDTVNQAFSKIEVTIENNENVNSAALNDLNSRILAMNKPDDAVNGQVVTTVSETNGIVSETKANVKDLQLGGYSKTLETGAIAGTDTINTALSKLENTVNAANDEMLTNITGSNAVTVSTKTDKNQTVSLKLDAATKPQGFTNADNALSITSEGLYLSSIIDCGDY